MNKKAIIILGGIFVLIVGTLGFIIWYRSSGDETTVELPEIVEEPVVEVPDEEIPEEEPEQSIGQAVRLTDEPVITPALFFQGDGIAYFNAAGQLFRTEMSVSGDTVLLSNKTELLVPAKTGISRILWPAVGSSYIAESGQGLSRRWSYYNPDTATYVELPSEIKSLDWMPSGNKIIFVWVGSDGKATLNISDPDTSNYQTLTDLYEGDNEIDVSPNGQTILFYRTQGSDPTRNTINSVSADGQTFRTVIAEGYNKGVLWSPDSKKFLFSRKDLSSGTSALYMADVSTGEVRNLGLATIETKALWAKDGLSIIAAVPVSGTAGQGQTTDKVVKIDLYTGAQNSYDPGTGMDIREMFTTLDGKVLFFKNGQDNSLYYMFLN